MSDELEPGATQAAESSVLGGLRARRERAIQKLEIDLVVPRYDPPIFVRFKVVSQARIDQVGKQTEKSKEKDRTVIANAILLADACVGVFEVDKDGAPVGDPAEWPCFDDQLAGILGIPWTRAQDVVRTVYVSDGDIISTAAKLGEHSGYATEMLERDPEGN